MESAPVIGKGSGPVDDERSLDPTDWQSFRALCHQAIDDMVDHLSPLDAQPAWQPMPADVLASLHADLPDEPTGEEAAYQDFLRLVMPYTNGNRHLRFFGWAQGNGTPLGMLADMLAAAI